MKSPSKSWAIAVALAAGCATAAPPAVVDLARPFLDGPCAAASDDAFVAGWSAYQAGHAELGKLYPSSATPDAGRRLEVCKRVRAVAIAAPAIVETLRPRVAALLGALPDSPLLLAVPVEGNDGGYRELEDGPVVAIHAGHETYDRTGGLVVTLAHELVHDAQHAARGAAAAALSATARKLFYEGGAVFAMTVMFPEVGERATGLSEEKVAAVRAGEAETARAMLAVWGGGAADDGWFSGTKLGYVVGLDVYRAIAQRRGAEAALRIQPKDFAQEARVELERLANR